METKGTDFIVNNLNLTNQNGVNQPLISKDNNNNSRKVNNSIEKKVPRTRTWRNVAKSYTQGSVHKYNQLKEAVLKGDIERAEEYILRGARTSAEDDWKKEGDVLTMAVRSGNINMVKMLLKNHVRPDGVLITVNALVTNPDNTPLRRALINRRIDIAKLLLDSGASWVTKDIYLAVDIGSSDLVETIINSQGDPTIRHYYTEKQFEQRKVMEARFAVNYACEIGKFEIAKLLVEKMKLDVKGLKCPGYKNTLKQMFSKGNSRNNKTTQKNRVNTVKISENSSKNNAFGKPTLVNTIKSYTSFNLSKFYGLERAVKNGDVEKVKKYLRRGAPLFVPEIRELDRQMRTTGVLLSTACKLGNITIVQLLLKAGANVNGCVLVDPKNSNSLKCPIDESSPLHISIHYEHIELVKLLLDSDCTIRFGDITEAIDLDNYEILRLLLDNLSKERLEENLRKFIEYACEKGHPEIGNFLVKNYGGDLKGTKCASKNAWT